MPNLQSAIQILKIKQTLKILKKGTKIQYINKNYGPSDKKETYTIGCIHPEVNAIFLKEPHHGIACIQHPKNKWATNINDILEITKIIK